VVTFGFAGTRRWVYPQSIDGRFQRLRRWCFVGLHLLLFATPWIRVGGYPALRVDLPQRQIHVLGAIYTANDTILLLLLLLFLAFSLFFFTSLFGRLWCGYGCPQTVLLDTWVRPVERWIEGAHTTRRRRDQGPWSWDRVWRKAAKWSWFAIAATVVSMAFMSLFAGARELWTGNAGRVEYTLVAVFAAGWFLDFAWFREQLCNYVCPYARFQSALTDDNSLMDIYDAPRGEPRGGRSAKLDGRCVDCFKCVSVCPQGIDIRNGFQLECINCARCVDACTDVMGRLGFGSLVEYGTLAQISGAPRRWLRPRVVIYAGLMTALVATAVLTVVNRVPFEAAVSRMPGSLFTVDADRSVRNTFLLRLANNANTGAPLAFQVRLEGLPGAELTVPELTLATAESRIVPLVVRLPADRAARRTLPLRLRVTAPVGERVLETTFKTGGALAPLE
jgi:cytochrome c oxidase accessory protein FixG